MADVLRVFLRPDANVYCGHSRSKEVRLVKAGTWPKPMRPGPYTFCWFQFELDTMNAATARGATDEQLRKLAREIEAARVNAGGPDWPPTFTLPEPRKPVVVLKRPRGRPRKVPAETMAAA
jgi:hypothetical protein